MLETNFFSYMVNVNAQKSLENSLLQAVTVQLFSD